MPYRARDIMAAVILMTSGRPSAQRLVPFSVGDWLVDPKACQLSRRGTVIKLRPQLVDLLVCLANRAGEIVLKDEILAEVWPGQFIAESGLSRCIAEVRQVLRDDVQQPQFIETIPKRGYRLIAPVSWHDPPAGSPPPIPAQDVPGQPAAHHAAGAIGTPEPPGTSRLTAPPVETSPAPPLRRRRRAWMGVALVAAVTGLVAVVMLTRTPAEVLTQQDTVLLAFENHTGDAVFDDTIPLAMSIQLEQSPYLGILAPGRVQETLRMMGLPADTRVTQAVGLQICERVGGRALIVTSIASLGRQYAVGLEAVACGTGRVLARRQVTTDRKERVLSGLQRAAVEIRSAVGEPSASLQRYSVPVVEATTPSLDALRALRRGDLARERGQAEVAIGYYREAVALDPEFALAHNRLGTVDWGVGRVASLQKAYALRQRVTLPERLEIEAAYHRYVTLEAARVIDALELLTRSYPRRAAARRDLAREYLDAAGRYEDALAQAVEAMRLEPDSPLSIAMAVRAYVYTNRLAEARQAAERGVLVGPRSLEAHFSLLLCGVVSGDRALQARERAWAAQQPDNVDFLDLDGEEAIKDGRLREAIGLLGKVEHWVAARSAQAPGVTEVGDLSDLPARIRLRMARYEALAGFEQRATRRLEAELRQRLGPIAKVEAATAAVSAGRMDVAGRLLDEIDREGRPGLWGETLSRANRAAVVASRGRTREALALLAPLQPIELGYGYGFEPLFRRALLHEQDHDWASAREAYEKILAHPTVDSGRKFLPHARLGLARALVAAGDRDGGRTAYQRFLEEWKDADRDLPVLLEARREYEALKRRETTPAPVAPARD